jgi:hypothetical protein
MVIVNGSNAEARPALSVTVTENLKMPAAVGIPLMTPKDGLSASPGGREPALTVQLL